MEMLEPDEEAKIRADHNKASPNRLQEAMRMISTKAMMKQTNRPTNFLFAKGNSSNNPLYSSWPDAELL